MAEREDIGEEALGFHVSEEVRRRCDFGASLFADDGRARLDSFRRVREFVRIYETEGIGGEPSAREGLSAGEVEALGVLDAVYRCLIEAVVQGERPEFEGEALEELRDELGDDAVDSLLENHVEVYPPPSVESGEEAPGDYLSGAGRGERRLVDLACTRLANGNPAAARYRELFDDEPLAEGTEYETGVELLEAIFDRQTGPGEADESLWSMLEAPAREAPGSLSAQLEYVRQHWSHLLPDWLRRRILTTVDVIREEEKARRFGAGGPPPPEPPEFGASAGAEARYSRDREWMPRLVLVAKNARVWLSQLSAKYDRRIEQLDEIPDEELRRLADQGMTGLWLIGLWERSSASATIKRRTGRSDAVASAYSIARYRIAEDLGGREGKERLEQKAAEYGIRLAADMVPNHMAIDSDWVIEHPDRFLSVDHPPFPAYSFEGPDLCEDDGVELYLEDHYYEQTDAAVVFQRVDAESGETRYVYHGNDGTSMPWNDTAQIDYLNPEAREAVIEQIVRVARAFPVIRFDAAMTLAKKQIHRLWYPEPGSGGDIPSRAERGMTRAEFDEEMPREFWREVVDRVAEEAPNTLLLAEAFWKMEGYFVRSLGMHRVYNSAFMNMLRDEDNAAYRTLIKKTLAFDPEVLRRYVNFMNNPDEETAVDQFGKGDKYFGICALMATMPGLPMFGHGQIEGFEEKYGMDFAEPMLDESPDRELVERHRREIFPLLHRRRHFAGVEHFRLYDVVRPDGGVDENVFAYSNEFEGERSLVVYHNRYGDTRGWIRESVEFRRASGESDGDGELVRETVGEALGFASDARVFVRFRDLVEGLEYIRSAADIAERGLYVELGAYDAHVFVDFQEIRDAGGGGYARLNDRLAGRGVESLEAELRRMRLEPVTRAVRSLLEAGRLRELAEFAGDERDEKDERDETGEKDRKRAFVEEFRSEARGFAEAVADYDGTGLEEYPAVVARELNALFEFRAVREEWDEECEAVAERVGGLVPEGPVELGILGGWTVLRGLGGDGAEWSAELAHRRIESWRLAEVLRESILGLGAESESAERAAEMARALLEFSDWGADLDGTNAGALEVVERAFARGRAASVLGVNEFEGTLWFHEESMEVFAASLFRIAALREVRRADSPGGAASAVAEVCGAVDLLLDAVESAHGRVDAFTAAVEQSGS